MAPTAEGYLRLSDEQARALISAAPIEDEYEVEEQPFARGKYAAVRRCRHRASGQTFAAKYLRKWRRAADLRPEILHEVAILDACRSSARVVRLHRVFESDQEMVLLLEMAQGGELQMLLDRDIVPEEAQVRQLMQQILMGLRDLHDLNVAHLDIKPQNLVLTGEFPKCDVKLCDLGISRYIGEGADIRDMLGTPDYVAPEVLNYEPISLATDMWSVGVLLYVLLTGCSPFGGDTKQETFCNISQCCLDFPEELFEDISEEAKDLMRKLIVKEPSKRLTVRQSLQHSWFSVTPSPKSSSTFTLQASTVSSVKTFSSSSTRETDRRENSVLPPQTTVTKIEKSVSTASVTSEKSSPTNIRKPMKEICTDNTTKNETSVSLSKKSESIIKAPVGKLTPALYPRITTNNSNTSVSKIKHDFESNDASYNASGMKSFRKTNFKKNMGSILERVKSCEDFEKTMEKSSTRSVFETNTKFSTRLAFSSKKVPAPETPAANSNASLASLTIPRFISRAKAMQTMPLRTTDNFTVCHENKTTILPVADVPKPEEKSIKKNNTPATLKTTLSFTPSANVSRSTLSPHVITTTVTGTGTATMTRTATALRSSTAITSSTTAMTAVTMTTAAAALTTATTMTTATTKPSNDKDCIYTFRKCFIVDDCENDNSNSLVSDGTNESETSSGYYDNFSCCSSSDSVSDVSETSVDLSGDRLSTTSMDSLDFSYGKERRHYHSSPISPFNSRQIHSSKTLPRGTTQGQAFQFATTTFRTTKEINQITLQKDAETQEKIFAAAKKQAAKGSHTTIINKIPRTTFIAPNVENNIRKEYALNITKDHNSNEVVLQEVKGGRFNRFSEVKIESVQSRIKKFQS